METETTILLPLPVRNERGERRFNSQILALLSPALSCLGGRTGRKRASIQACRLNSTAMHPSPLSRGEGGPSARLQQVRILAGFRQVHGQGESSVAPCFPFSILHPRCSRTCPCLNSSK